MSTSLAPSMHCVLLCECKCVWCQKIVCGTHLYYNCNHSISFFIITALNYTVIVSKTDVFGITLRKERWKDLQLNSYENVGFWFKWKGHINTSIRETKKISVFQNGHDLVLFPFLSNPYTDATLFAWHICLRVRKGNKGQNVIKLFLSQESTNRGNIYLKRTVSLVKKKMNLLQRAVEPHSDRIGGD